MRDVFDEIMHTGCENRMEMQGSDTLLISFNSKCIICVNEMSERLSHIL